MNIEASVDDLLRTNGYASSTHNHLVMKAAVLLGTTLVCAGISASGFAVLLFLLLTRSLAPPNAYFEKELFFDYTKPAAVASTNFCKSPAPMKASAANARFLQPGQSMSVWLALVTPETHGTSNADVFQVAAELVTADGRVAASASRPCLVTYRSPVVRYIRMLARLPLVLVGWYEEKQLLKVPLFKGYKEKAGEPFCVFRVALMARANGGELPGIYSAYVHIDLKLGLVGRALYKIRPGTVATYVLGIVGLAAFCGGGLASLLLLAMWSISRRHVDTRVVDKSRQYDEVSSETGWSEVSTGELESESDRDRDGAMLDPGASVSERGMLSPGESPLVTPLSAQALRRWDARSASQLSVSTDGTPLDEVYSRSNHKKYR
ncbi:probable seipin [Coccomyxa sp. Obi]|nr:probable seipin [Coccomyxa sp. Obi]